MNAGMLNRKITIQTIPEINDHGNVYPGTPAAWKTVWAEIITTGGREYYAAQRLNAETSAVFKIRYVSGITTKMQIKYGTRIFDILSVNDVDERHTELQISAKEVV